MALSADLAPSPRETAENRRYWVIPVARAVVAAIIAIAITFSQDHSVRVGLVTFGAYALLEGAILLALSAKRLPARVSRSLPAAQGIVGVLAGAAALVLWAVEPAGASVALYLGIVIAWAVLTGAAELVAGLGARGRTAAARDWIVTGSATIALALVLLLVRPDWVLHFDGDGKVPAGVLNASIMSVGLFGAYAAIVAVYLFIGGLSLKWAAASDQADRSAATQEAVS